MVIFLSISILLVLLEPVNHANFKYACVVWIGSQIREIFTADFMSFGPILPQILFNNIKYKFRFYFKKKKPSWRRFLGVGRVTGDKQLFFLGLNAATSMVKKKFRV